MKLNWLTIVGLILLAIGAVAAYLIDVPQDFLVQIIAFTAAFVFGIIGAIKDYVGKQDWSFWLVLISTIIGVALLAIGGISQEIMVAFVGGIFVLAAIIAGIIFKSKEA